MLPAQGISSKRKQRWQVSSDRACLQCQRRKTKCTGGGEGQACSYCSKTGKACVFGISPSRTALTRANLDAAELRCQKLELLLRQTKADLDIDSAVENSVIQDGSEAPNTPSPVTATRAAGQSGDGTPPIDYEWHETTPSVLGEDSAVAHSVQDGMASLTMDSRSSGYLGNSSGSRLLESISSLLRTSSGGMARSQMTDAPPDSTGGYDLFSSRIVANNLMHDHLINAYFIGFNRSYPIIHEPTFRDRCGKRAQMSTSSSWNIIFYMVLAIGEWISGFCGDDQSLYYDAARSRLRFELLESGTFGIVQAFLLLGNYLQKRDRPNTGYNFIGIAYRVALGLGLHKETAPSQGTETCFHHRRRVLFWILYCFESGFSITTGRPTVISDGFIDIRKPSNIVDSQINASLPLPKEVEYPTTYSAIIAQARLAVIANKIYNRFLSTSKYDSDIDHHTLVMEQALQNWRSSLPSFFRTPDCPAWFRGPRQVVLWKEANLRTLLLLASQKHQTDEHERIVVGSRCQVVAAETIFDIAGLCREHPDVVHIGISWYAVYFLLQATLALGVHSLERSRSKFPTFEWNDAQVTWESAVSEAHQCLELLGRTNKAALRSLQVLDRLRKQMNSSLSNAEAGGEGTASLQDLTQPPLLGDSVTAAMVDVPPPNFATIAPPIEMSPEGLASVDFVQNQWMGSIDPSLHMFFDNSEAVGGLFQSVQGFPSVLEQEYFGYVTGSMQNTTSSLWNNSYQNEANRQRDNFNWEGTYESPI